MLYGTWVFPVQFPQHLIGSKNSTNLIVSVNMFRVAITPFFWLLQKPFHWLPCFLLRPLSISSQLSSHSNLDQVTPLSKSPLMVFFLTRIQAKVLTVIYRSSYSGFLLSLWLHLYSLTLTRFSRHVGPVSKTLGSACAYSVGAHVFI